MFTSRIIVSLAASTLTLLPPFAFADGLGPADGFTIFTIDSYQANNTDCTGRVAVGGTASYNNFGVGSSLEDSSGTRDDLIVAGNLSWNNGQNFYGNTQVIGSTVLLNVGTPNGSVGTIVDIDFDEAEEELQEISDELFDTSANGQVTNNWGQLSMIGYHEDFNVFLLTQGDLNPLWGMSIIVPNGSTVLINVDNSHMQLNNFQPTLQGCDPSSVLFNFPSASSINMNGIGWQGTILAPQANVQFNNGQIDGALICKSINGNGESHHYPFDGDLPDGDEDDCDDDEESCQCCCHDDDDDDCDDNDGDDDGDDNDDCDDNDSDGDDDCDDEGDDDDNHDSDGDDNDDCDDDHNDDCECDCDCNTPFGIAMYD